jgi:hypothetical protein
MVLDEDLVFEGKMLTFRKKKTGYPGIAVQRT